MPPSVITRFSGEGKKKKNKCRDDKTGGMSKVKSEAITSESNGGQVVWPGMVQFSPAAARSTIYGLAVTGITKFNLHS